MDPKHDQLELEDRKRTANTNVLLKLTNDCNLRCEYCFDRPMREKLGSLQMSHEDACHVLDVINVSAEKCQLIYHGGESTLMGRQYFEDMMDEYYKRYATEYDLSMQTNGVLLSRDHGWVDTFNKTGIGAGTSYDGYTQSIRLGSDQIDFASMIKHYNKHLNSPLGALTVVNSQNVGEMITTYEKFKEDFGDDFRYSYNPIFSTSNEKSASLEIDVDVFVEYYRTYLRHYMNDIESEVEERSVVEFLSLVMGNTDHITCNHCDCRESWIGINADGSIFPCDRMIENYELGNIKDFEHLDEIRETEAYKRYYDDNQTRFDTECAECGIFDICKGGCNSNHIADNPTGRADVCSQNECELIRKRVLVMYELIQELNPTDKVNKIFREMILEAGRLLPKEIEEFLKSKGYDIDMQIDFSKVEDYKDVIFSPQYKIFRAFNPVIEGSYSYYDQPESINNTLRVAKEHDNVMEMLTVQYDKSKKLIEKEVKNAAENQRRSK